ncbi:hypothetical protein BH23CHL5_BH23CHL5_15410 [soil metagenome]
MIILSIVLFGLLVAAWLVAPNGEPVTLESRDVEPAGLQPEAQTA